MARKNAISFVSPLVENMSEITEALLYRMAYTCPSFSVQISTVCAWRKLLLLENLRKCH